MSDVSINYKGEEIASMSEAGTKTLETEGKYCEDNIEVVYAGGLDTSDATAAAGDILYGKTAYVNGSKVTGSIATKTGSNLSASGKRVTVPAGYYASQYYKDVATGSATAPASISGSSATVSTGTNTLTLTKTVSVTPSVTAGYVASGTAGNSSVSLSASVTTKAAATITPGTTDQTISSGQYLTGTQTIKGDANLVAGNIKSGVSIFGVSGTHTSGTDTSDATAAAGDILSGKTAYVNGSKVTGTIASQAAQTITPGTSNKTIASGKYLSGVQTIKGDANLVAGNIKSGVSIFGVTGNYKGPTTFSVPMDRLVQTLYIITSNNMWSRNAEASSYRGSVVVIPTNATSVSIVCQRSGSVFAFLSSADITNGTVAFSSGYSERMLKDAGTYSYSITSTMKFIYFYDTNGSGVSYRPTSITFTLS